MFRHVGGLGRPMQKTRFALTALLCAAVGLAFDTADASETGRASPQCQRVLDLQDRISALLDEQGMVATQLDAIAADTGLPTEGRTGVFTVSNCARAIPLFDRYLADLLAGPIEDVAAVDDSGGDAGSDVFGEGLRIGGVAAGDKVDVFQAPGVLFAVLGQLPADARDITIVDGCLPRINRDVWPELNRAERIEALAGGWCLVEWQGVRGWVLGQHLRPG